MPQVPRPGSLPEPVGNRLGNALAARKKGAVPPRRRPQDRPALRGPLAPGSGEAPLVGGNDRKIPEAMTTIVILIALLALGEVIVAKLDDWGLI